MKFLNLGLAEIILIVILALIVLGPGNMVKAARDAGAFIRRITKSPYWQEVWATRRELNEIPKILAREAKLEETIKDLDSETKGIRSSVSSTVTELIKEVEEPLKEVDADLKKEPPVTIEIPAPTSEQGGDVPS
ncbi:MAG: hypothetical protein KBD67_04780 [Anaerolineaceae bacterium]|nr:hypothetical protein [Anaerolineaceae bacterium]